MWNLRKLLSQNTTWKKNILILIMEYYVQSSKTTVIRIGDITDSFEMNKQMDSPKSFHKKG